MTEPATKTSARSAAEDALLDAAERLLVEIGYAKITTRRLAEAAGVNNGLVHYYFGSNEALLVRALERFTDRLIERQRELYAADVAMVRAALGDERFEDVAAEGRGMRLEEVVAYALAGPTEVPGAEVR